MTTSNDARTPQPYRATLDLSGQGKGGIFFALIETAPYSGLKSEQVYVRELTVRFRAQDFAHAVTFAQAMAVVIEQGHDVWKSTVRQVADGDLWLTYGGGTV